MAIVTKKIESFQIVFVTEGEYSFDKVIISDDVVERDAIRIKGKDVSLRILKKNAAIIVGIVETSRNENIPAKKNRRNKKISGLGLAIEEGLVYGNIFIYERERNILMYEVNKFGCFVDHFLKYIQRCCKGSDEFKDFDIKLNPVLKSNEYQRMQNMTFHKSLLLEVANPKQIIKAYRHKNDALWNACSSGAKLGCTKVKALLSVDARGNTVGLSSLSLQTIVDRALSLFRGPLGDNIKKIQVEGYESDSDDNKLIPIDLIADRYIQFMELDEPRENTDLLENQRTAKILELYEDCVDDFDSIFGK